MHRYDLLVAIDSLIGGTYTAMFGNSATLAHWSSTSRLSSIAIDAHRHVYDLFINERACPSRTSGRACTDRVVNLFF